MKRKGKCKKNKRKDENAKVSTNMESLKYERLNAGRYNVLFWAILFYSTIYRYRSRVWLSLSVLVNYPGETHLAKSDVRVSRAQLEFFADGVMITLGRIPAILSKHIWNQC